MSAALRMRPRRPALPITGYRNIRSIHTDDRYRISQFWTPTKAPDKEAKGRENGFSLLMRAGFIHQSHSGIFHLLPLGLRVQEKLERLIDKHMRRMGASKVSLSTITTKALWKRSGRYSDDNLELLRVKDRKDSGFLLSPTHEEEITEIVRNNVLTYKQLPLRLYQITRKYRDEKRPRQGLLRSKEFLMKDLYTFDSTHELSLQTYQEATQAYTNLFRELGVPFVIANADSGNMGGNLSHEYHFLDPRGEDNVWKCDSCSYTANEEVVQKRMVPEEELMKRREEGKGKESGSIAFIGITMDRNTKVFIHVPTPLGYSEIADVAHWRRAHEHLNLHAAKSLVPDLDTGIESPTLTSIMQNAPPEKEVHIYDYRVVPQILESGSSASSSTPSSSSFPDPGSGSGSGTSTSAQAQPPPTPSPEPSTPDPSATSISPQTPTTQPHPPTDLTKIHERDPCPKCSSGKLTSHKAIEIAHTFHLGTRYSAPLSALIALPSTPSRHPIHMGCHGIGLSRIIGAIPFLYSTPRGLRWPIRIAPFQVLLFAVGKGVGEKEVEGVYDGLVGRGLDVVIDDRDVGVGWKFRDAELVGYPVVVVLGERWVKGGEAEVQFPGRNVVGEQLLPGMKGDKVQGGGKGMKDVYVKKEVLVDTVEKMVKGEERGEGVVEGMVAKGKEEAGKGEEDRGEGEEELSVWDKLVREYKEEKK